jgi:sortase A
MDAGLGECPAMPSLSRTLSIALITAGLVVLLDAGVTLVWQEPMSAAYGHLQQQQAEEELADLERGFPTDADLAAVAGIEGDEAKVAALAGIFKDRVSRGDAIGRMSIDRVGLDIVLLEGTDTGTLQKGPGRYLQTALPGQGDTVGVAGHRTTYLAPFRQIDEIKDGDEIRVEMPYGVFTYSVTGHEIVDPGAVEIVDPVGFEQLVLTACHPEYSAAQRYAIFAKLKRIDTFAAGGTGAWVTP